MTANLWTENRPADFWQCEPAIPEDVWRKATRHALPLLELPDAVVDPDDVLAQTLGEAQFGPARYRLSRKKRLYYRLKPLLPRRWICFLRRIYNRSAGTAHCLGYPVEDRYVRFQREVLRQALLLTGRSSVMFRSFWPNDAAFAFVITHDIETAEGQRFVRDVASLDSECGFRSSFNFVPERYAIDQSLVDDLRDKGFEIGIHGLNHDSGLFSSQRAFEQRAIRINGHLSRFDAAGFRSPYTHRNPEWMQQLAMDYDSSFFDTDPYEPMPGGCMSIHPYFLGRFVELPMTLIQDHTLVVLMSETSPRLWLEKVDFIRQFGGMALVNAHPDYLRQKTVMTVYGQFLETMRQAADCWNALPRNVACWWKARSGIPSASSLPIDWRSAVLEADGIRVVNCREAQIDSR